MNLFVLCWSPSCANVAANVACKIAAEVLLDVYMSHVTYLRSLYKQVVNVDVYMSCVTRLRRSHLMCIVVMSHVCVASSHVYVSHVIC